MHKGVKWIIKHKKYNESKSETNKQAMNKQICSYIINTYIGA